MNAKCGWRFALAAASAVVVVSPVRVGRATMVAPPWDPNGPATVQAHWDLTPTEPVLQYMFGTDPDGMGTDVQSPDPTGFGLNHQHDSGGSIWTFQIPNWIDTYPVKCIQIQIKYTFDNDPMTPETHPVIGGFMAFDPIFMPTGMVPPENITNKVIFTPTLHEDGSWLGGGLWQIVPNPDWEKFDVAVVVGVMLDAVWIDTISAIPEPTAFMLGGGVCGVVGLCCLARRLALIRRQALPIM